MADVPITTAPEPDGAPRIAVLDILRGIAILGILFMNINDMGQSLNASAMDVRHLGWSATDRIAWWLREVLANGTARCLLELLFGAGMVILTGRLEERAGGWAVLRRYYVRNIVLIAFGLVHVFVLLWPGDILHTYGIAALIAFLFREMRTRWLLLFGASFALLLLQSGAGTYALNAAQQAAVLRVEARQRQHHDLTAADRSVLEAQVLSQQARADTSTRIAAEDSARRGSFATWAAAQRGEFVRMERQSFEIMWVWEAAATMLIGAALFRLRILQGGRSRRWYVGLTLCAYAVGFSLRVLAAYDQTHFDGLAHISAATVEVGRLAMTLGHVGLINLLAASAAGARLLRPFVAAGRTALSIYVAQTLVCLWVLYPPFMLALYGKMTWGPLMATAFAVDAALLWGANRWMRRYDIAPVEWAWRSLIEGRALPWRRSPAAQSQLEPSPA